MPFQYESTCLNDWHADKTTTNRERLVVTLNGGAKFLVRANPHDVDGDHVIDREEVPECLVDAFGYSRLEPYLDRDETMVIPYIQVYQTSDGRVCFTLAETDSVIEVSSRADVISVREAPLEDTKIDNFQLTGLKTRP